MRVKPLGIILAVIETTGNLVQVESLAGFETKAHGRDDVLYRPIWLDLGAINP